MMMFFELFLLKKYLSSQAIVGDQKIVSSSPAWELRYFSE